MTCLLSGLEGFRLRDPGQNEILLVANGLYGFLVYATEFWTEYLLCYEPAQESRLESSTEPFLRLAGQLADKLERLDPTSLDKRTSGDLVDKRLAKLQKYGVLWKHVERALNSRSPKSLEARVFKTQGMFWHQPFSIYTNSLIQWKKEHGIVLNRCRFPIQSVICLLRTKKLSNR